MCKYIDLHRNCGLCIFELALKNVSMTMVSMTPDTFYYACRGEFRKNCIAVNLPNLLTLKMGKRGRFIKFIIFSTLNARIVDK